MTTNTFDTEESNSNISSPQYYVDDDGSLKFISPVLSSSNFDGSVPVFEGQITADALSPGKFIKIGEEYFPIISVSYDDQELEEDPSEEITVTYLDSNSEVQEIIYNLFDDVDVKYENWDEKYLGTEGWSLTYGGNAIFTNVAVRGDLEATTLDVGGVDGITYDGSTVVIGASVVVNAPIEFNGVTPEELSASLAGYIPDGGAAFDINTNVTTINGDQITSGTVTADQINTNNLFVQNLVSFSTTNASRIKILDINDQRHKLQFETGWTREVVPAFIGSSTYVNPNVGFGGSSMGIDINAGLLNLGVTSDPANIRLLSRSFSSTSKEREIIYNADSHAFRSIVSTESEFSVFGFKNVFISNTSNPPSGVDLFSIRMDPVNGFNINGPVTFTGNVSGTFVGDGSGLTNIPAPTSIPASSITSGTLADARIPNLAASKITSGTFATARIPTNISITGNAATATRATNANNLDSGQTGGARITGNNVLVTSIGSGTTSNETLRRNSSNQMRAVAASSRKIKTDISLLEDLDILNIDVVQYKYIEGYLDENDQRVDALIPGFIAEQIYEEIPIAVDLDENGEPRNWNDRIIIPIMVKTIQDQQKLIEDLQNRMLQLESQLGG